VKEGKKVGGSSEKVPYEKGRGAPGGSQKSEGTVNVEKRGRLREGGVVDQKGTVT